MTWRQTKDNRIQLSFNRLLKKLADSFTADELEDLKFLFRRIIGKRYLEKVTARSFLEKLVEEGLISSHNVIVLQSLLRDIYRDDLGFEVFSFCQQHPGIIYYRYDETGDELVYVQAKGLSLTHTEALQLMSTTQAWLGEDSHVSIELDDRNCNLLEPGFVLETSAEPETKPFTCFQRCPFRTRYVDEVKMSCDLQNQLHQAQNTIVDMKGQRTLLKDQLDEERQLNEFMFRNYEEVKTEADTLKIMYDLEHSKNTNKYVMRRVEDFIRFLTTKINRVYDNEVQNKRRSHCMDHRTAIHQNISTPNFQGVIKQHEDIDKFLRTKISRVCNFYGYQIAAQNKA